MLTVWKRRSVTRAEHPAACAQFGLLPLRFEKHNFALQDVRSGALSRDRMGENEDRQSPAQYDLAINGYTNLCPPNRVGERRGTLAKVEASFLSNKTQNRSLQGCCSGRASGWVLRKWWSTWIRVRTCS